MTSPKGPWHWKWPAISSSWYQRWPWYL